MTFCDLCTLRLLPSRFTTLQHHRAQLLLLRQTLGHLRHGSRLEQQKIRVLLGFTWHSCFVHCVFLFFFCVFTMCFIMRFRFSLLFLNCMLHVLSILWILFILFETKPLDLQTKWRKPTCLNITRGLTHVLGHSAAPTASASKRHLWPSRWTEG